MIKNIDLDERVHSGPVRFGDAWPGAFLTGDHAMAMADALRMYLKDNNNLLAKMYVEELADELEACLLSDFGDRWSKPRNGSPT